MKNRNGFTLVEVVLASMLLGMVLLAAFPLIMTGQNVIRREQMEAEARMIGDRVFHRISEEIQGAVHIYFGTFEELEKVEKIKVDDWIEAGVDEIADGFDITIEAEEAEHGWMLLKMSVRKDETVIYEREEVIPLLNMMLFGNREPEGEYTSGFVNIGEDRKQNRPGIWYQKGE